MLQIQRIIEMSFHTVDREGRREVGSDTIVIIGHAIIALLQ